MGKKVLPKGENIYETDCPILYAMGLIGQKWKLPILWYIADASFGAWKNLDTGAGVCL